MDQKILISRENNQKLFHILKILKKINIKLIRQNKNHGLAFSVLNAIKTEFKSNDAIILIEDDCAPKGFLNTFINLLKNIKMKKKKN